MLKQLFASNKRPYFRNIGPWETRKFDLSGCQLEITMPPHDFEFPEENRGASFNVFDPDLYSYKFEVEDKRIPPSNEGVTHPAIFNRKWESYGAIWRAQPLGFLQSSLVVCDTSRMNTSLNCFNSEHMERLIVHSLYYSRGPGFSREIEAKSPVNWEVRCINGLDFVYFESHRQKPAWSHFVAQYMGAHFTPCLVVPLFEDKYLYFAFSATGSLPAEPSVMLMRERVNQIISSIKLHYSAEATKQKTAAQQKYPGTSYSPHRKPEQWQYYESFRDGDPLKEEDSIVLEGECSPPPSLDTPINLNHGKGK